MVYAFFCLLALCVAVGVFSWMALRKITTHMRKNPEAAKLVAEHILAALLQGEEKTEESPKEEPPDIGLENNGQTILTSRPK